MRHQRPCRRSLRPERAALALWARGLRCVGLCARQLDGVESTADDHLPLHLTVGDANVSKHTPSRSRGGTGHTVLA